MRLCKQLDLHATQHLSCFVVQTLAESLKWPGMARLVRPPCSPRQLLVPWHVSGHPDLPVCTPETCKSTKTPSDLVRRRLPTNIANDRKAPRREVPAAQRLGPVARPQPAEQNRGSGPLGMGGWPGGTEEAEDEEQMIDLTRLAAACNALLRSEAGASSVDSNNGVDSTASIGSRRGIPCKDARTCLHLMHRFKHTFLTSARRQPVAHMSTAAPYSSSPALIALLLQADISLTIFRVARHAPSLWRTSACGRAELATDSTDSHWFAHVAKLKFKLLPPCISH